MQRPVKQRLSRASTCGLSSCGKTSWTGLPHLKAVQIPHIEDVVRYLDGLGLGHVANKFRENAVDGDFLATLCEEDLVAELGLTRLQARKVLQRLP